MEETSKSQVITTASITTKSHDSVKLVTHQGAPLFLNEFPLELLLRVFHHLGRDPKSRENGNDRDGTLQSGQGGPLEVCRISRVCRRWAEIINGEIMDSTYWRELCRGNGWGGKDELTDFNSISSWKEVYVYHEKIVQSWLRSNPYEIKASSCCGAQEMAKAGGGNESVGERTGKDLEEVGKVGIKKSDCEYEKYKSGAVPYLCPMDVDLWGQILDFQAV
eukprot:Nk52_evm1s124 gene=Nk52_evmTU1s124